MKNKTNIVIKCFKNDGSFHRSRTKQQLVVNDENYFIFVSKQALVTESNGRQWMTREPAITIFPKDKWFNVIAMLKNPYVSYYVNLASPPILDGNFIKYVDYDLDLKLNFENEIKVIDINEYNIHKKQYGYTEELDKILHDTINEIKQMMDERVFPFDDLKNIDLYYEALEDEI